MPIEMRIEFTSSVVGNDLDFHQITIMRETSEILPQVVGKWVESMQNFGVPAEFIQDVFIMLAKVYSQLSNDEYIPVARYNLGYASIEVSAKFV
jgi:hypothetical protein